MEAIRADVRERLERLGHGAAEVRTVLAPPWSTDWITEEGRRKLAEHGIAPPSGAAPVGPVPEALRHIDPGHPPVRLSVKCPQCGSPDTRTLSRFGSTACKELRVCEACKEPFDHVKPL